LQEAGYRLEGVMFHEARFDAPIRPIVAGTVGRARLEAIRGLR